MQWGSSRTLWCTRIALGSCRDTGLALCVWDSSKSLMSSQVILLLLLAKVLRLAQEGVREEPHTGQETRSYNDMLEDPQM